jgi:hypothetical protein
MLNWKGILGLGGLLGVAMIGVLIVGGVQSGSLAVAGLSQTSAPAFVWPARPLSLPANQAQMVTRLHPEIREAYEYALAHPEVLQYIPCYCGCEPLGHTSNLACYVRREANDGISLDPHGSGCKICVDITLAVKAQMNQGLPLDQIRKNIDATFSQYGKGTQTPLPPG